MSPFGIVLLLVEFDLLLEVVFKGCFVFFWERCTIKVISSGLESQLAYFIELMFYSVSKETSLKLRYMVEFKVNIKYILYFMSIYSISYS